MKTNFNEDIIISLYLSGCTFREVSQKTGISLYYIRKILIKNNITIRKTSGLKFHVNKVRVPLSLIKDKKDTPEFDYFLGILATDGNICKSKIGLQFAENNKEILEHWVDFLHGTVNIKSFIRKKTGRTYYEVKFKNQEIADYYKNLGITERKTHTLKLRYINWNVILGIFDGDGCLSIDNRHPNYPLYRISICSASIDFINQLNDFFVSYNLHPITRKIKTYYDISIGRKEEVKFIFSNIYKESTYFLHRKYDKFWLPNGKLLGQPSVNSVKGMDNHKTEPSLVEEGAETRNGVPK